MQKNIEFTSVTLVLLLGCSVMLAGCDVITAQNITNTGSAQGMNGGGMPNGGGLGINGGTPRGERGGTGMNDRTGSPDMMQGMTADMTGRVISLNGTTITVALLEMQTNASASASNQTQQGNSPSRSMEMTDTGVEVKLTIPEDAVIMEVMGMDIPGNSSANANSSMQWSDLKKEDIVMVWYKDNTKTVERIVVLQ
ncbi:hypothetical protein C0Q44_01080 [Paenibacillus sp. PCH8]|uniref:hypothetical protein n=1 Tax=Paenibacillus sp. PCH8 TaxID=2066524 RepID=UPI000CF97C72|nr:hypothetical protein [Paenibacillus sp. PCH8]PQP83344.1 hypothetical protein C0Q44_01080 [Paenibacillus sp. PCH8]